jgi:hypothetical protein
MARKKRAPPSPAQTPKDAPPAQKQSIFKRYAPVLGDIVLGVGISALANSFDEIVRLDTSALQNDKFVILFAIGFIISGAILRRG